MQRLMMVVALLLVAAVARGQETLDVGEIYLGTTPCRILSGSGSPEGSVTAEPCSIYLRTSDGQIWRKATGSSTTGWVQMSAVPGGGTGLTTATTNGVLYGNGTSALGVTSAPGANTVFAGNSSTPFFTSTPTVSQLTATTEIQSPLVTASEIASGGNIDLDPAGDYVLPKDAYTQYLGALNRKWLGLHVAELFAQTLVSQDVLSTVGGRVLVAPSTSLTSSIAGGDTSISVKHNNLSNGDRIVLEGNSQVEWMAVTSAASGSGPYSYDVTRNLDGSGANSWLAGDAVVNTGTTGDGFLDLYADSGLLPGSTVGPTIAGTVRTGTTYSDLSPRWAIGNLNGLFGYSSDTYGAAFGTPSAAWLKIDPTNGVRIGHNATTNVQLDASGNASFSGALTSTSGTLGGLTLASGSLTATNLGLYSGAANTARVEVGTGSNVSGLNSGNASGDVCMWAGDSHANRTSAEFRVTCGGAATMTGATITGPEILLQPSGSTPTVAGSIRFQRAAGTGFGQTGDAFSLYGISDGASQQLVLVNDAVGNATSDGEAVVGLLAQGWDSPSTALGQAQLTVASSVSGGPNVQVVLNESLNDTFTFSGDGLSPGANNQLDLGSSGSRWKSVRAETYFSGTTQGITDSCNGTVPLTVSDGLMTACTSTSDERAKDIAGEWRTGLAAVMALRPIRYTFKPEHGAHAMGELVGLSAQNVREAIPEMVKEGEDGLLSIPYTMPLIAALVNAVQELTARVAELEAQVGR